MSQLGLFGDSGTPTTPGAPFEPLVFEGDEALAQSLPARIRFGPSSWTFPGWGGVLYEGSPTEKDLVARGLAAVAKHPLLRAVGIDRSYYAPLTETELADYAIQIEDAGRADFVAVSKVWNEITTFAFPRHPRYGERAGERNPKFFSKGAFDEVLDAYRNAFARYAGPFVFEIPPSPIAPSPAEFARRTHEFFGSLPTSFRYAVELRNRELVSDAYLNALRSHNVAHVFNFWSDMPTLRAQFRRIGFTADFAAARIMLPPRTRYEQLREAYAPFNRIVREQPDMREDVVAIARACIESNRDLFVLVSNKAEGCAPLTIRGLAEAICRA